MFEVTQTVLGNWYYPTQIQTAKEQCILPGDTQSLASQTATLRICELLVVCIPVVCIQLYIRIVSEHLGFLRLEVSASVKMWKQWKWQMFKVNRKFIPHRYEISASIRIHIGWIRYSLLTILGPVSGIGIRLRFPLIDTIVWSPCVLAIYH